MTYTRLPDNLPTILRSHGLKVVEVAGWKTRGRPASKGEFKPVGVTCHHTVTGKNWTDASVVNYLIKGRADTPGPLVQFGLGRDGTVYLIASGRCNHAGTAHASGTVVAGDGNALYIGIEAFNDGVKEAYPKVQYDAYVLLCAVLSVYITKNSVNTVRGHKETSTSGKVDPKFDMAVFRKAVEAKMKQLVAADKAPAKPATPPTKPTTPPVVKPATPVTPKVTKGDDFNGPGWVNPLKWGLYDKANGNETYGYTDPAACHKYTANAVRLDGTDKLIITATRIKAGEKFWYSGFLSSRDAKCFYPLFGTFKIKATLPQASGIWPAIWLRAKKDGASRAEVDIAEVFFAGGDQVSQHIHFPNTTGTSVFGKGLKLPAGAHEYWVKIIPDGTGILFTMGVDDKVSGTYRHPDAAALLKDADPNEFWDIALNVAVSDRKDTGSQANTASPQKMIVDFVEWSK